MNKTSFTKILFFLLVGIEHINASSSNLRKRKATATTTWFIDTVSSIFMKEDWSCCDGTNEPTPVPTVTVDVPTSSSTSPTSSVTNTATTLRPTFIPTSSPSFIPSSSPRPSSSISPTYMEKKLTASDGKPKDNFGWSCSMSSDSIVIGAPYVSSEGTASAAYLYHLNGNEIKKLTPGDDGEYNDYFGWSVSVDEKVVVGTWSSNYVRVFSPEGEYERTIVCDDCLSFGRAVRTYESKILISGFQNFIWKLFIYTTAGELLKTIDNDDNSISDAGVAISDEVIVFTTGQKTVVYSNTTPDFEKIVEIPRGGLTVATSGGRIVIGDITTNGLNGTAWLYGTDGSFITTLEHDSQHVGSSVDITDDKIIVGAVGDDEGGNDAGSVFIYSAATGDFQEKVFAPDGQENDFFGSSVCASGSYYVIGANGVDDYTGAAYLFPLSD